MHDDNRSGNRAVCNCRVDTIRNIADVGVCVGGSYRGKDCEGMMTDWDRSIALLVDAVVDNTLAGTFQSAETEHTCRTALRSAIAQLEQERDNLKTVLHGNQDADYDKQLQIETLKSQLAEAEADADRLAKELQDWIVFAEANDQIYAARSGMNAMLHHQKRKEGK